MHERIALWGLRSCIAQKPTEAYLTSLCCCMLLSSCSKDSLSKLYLHVTPKTLYSIYQLGNFRKICINVILIYNDSDSNTHSLLHDEYTHTTFKPSTRVHVYLRHEYMVKTHLECNVWSFLLCRICWYFYQHHDSVICVDEVYLSETSPFCCGGISTLQCL